LELAGQVRKIALRRHPQLTHQLGAMVSRRTLGTLVAGYVCVVLLVATIFWPLWRGGAVDGDIGWLRSWTDIASGLFGLPVEASFDGGYALLGLFVRVMGMIMRGLFLGVVVVKILSMQPLAWRSSVAVTRSPSGEVALVGRFYNRLFINLYDLEIRAFVRTQSTVDGTSFISNRDMLLLGRAAKRVASLSWPISKPGTPYSIRVPTEDDAPARILESSSFELDGLSVKSGSEVVFLVTGRIAGLGTTFLSERLYKFPADFSLGRPGQIDPTQNKPQTWRGWENFEGTEDLYVFGYGSLADRDHMEKFLHRPLQDTGDFVPATLLGFRRAWNVSMENMDTVAGYKYYIDLDAEQDDQRLDGAVAFLGIRDDPAHEVNGALVRITRGDLQTLDKRERNYDRLDVSHRIRVNGGLQRSSHHLRATS